MCYTAHGYIRLLHVGLPRHDLTLQSLHLQLHPGYLHYLHMSIFLIFYTVAFNAAPTFYRAHIGCAQFANLSRVLGVHLLKFFVRIRYFNHVMYIYWNLERPIFGE